MTQGWAKILLYGTTTFFSTSLLAAPQYLSSIIEPAEEIRDQHFAELNGDGLRDLLLSVWSEARGRELLLYLQTENGQFSGKPSQRIEIKKDIIGYGLADLREEPGEELVFLTRSAAYDYSTRKDGYAGNLRKLLDWDLLATVPERQSIAFVGRLEDYNNDGHADLLLPGRQTYGLFYGDEDGGFRSVVPFPAPYSDPERNGDNSAGFRISVEAGLTFNVDSPSAFAGLFPERPELRDSETSTSRPFGNQDSILNVERWLASVQPAQVNGDDMLDFVYLDDLPGEHEGSKRRFNALFQNSEGAISDEADWQQTLDASGEILLADFNGDGLHDVLSLESKGSKQSNVSFFANRNGEYDFQSADQVLRFSGYEVEVQLIDLNDNKQPELIVSYYSLAAMDALRSGSMLRTTLIYAGNPASEDDGEALAFARRPNSKMEDKFSADSVKGLTERPHFSADLTGDHRKEVIALDDSGAVVAKTIAADLQIASDPIWRFVPLHLVESLVPEALNQDQSMDFLLIHQNALTVLVSRP